MDCNCSVVNLILATVIFVLALFPTLLNDVNTSLWVIVVSSALILIHSVVHAPCQKCVSVPRVKRATKQVKKRKKRR